MVAYAMKPRQGNLLAVAAGARLMHAWARTARYDGQTVVGQVCLALARDADMGIIDREMHHGQGPTCASRTWHLG
jgi:hypothetical protein